VLDGRILDDPALKEARTAVLRKDGVRIVYTEAAIYFGEISRMFDAWR